MTISTWWNFGRPAPPERVSVARRKFLAPPYYSQRAVFASPLSAFLLLFSLCNSCMTSRDPGHAHLGVVLWSLRREAPSSMSVPYLKAWSSILSKVIRGSQISPRRRPPSRGAREGQNLISLRWSLPLPINPVWWGSMHAISGYRSNRPTNTQTHTHTPTDRTDYNTLRRLARSVIIDYTSTYRMSFTMSWSFNPAKISYCFDDW